MSKATEPVTTNPSRRTVLAGAPVAAAATLAAGAAVNSLAVAVAASSAPDPIFVAIAAYRAAVKAYSAACNADEDDEDLVHDTGDAHVDALKELLACRPTTLRGVVALLELLAEPDHGHDPEYTVLAGAIGWDGPIKNAAMKLPAVLAGVISQNIMAGGQS